MISAWINDLMKLTDENWTRYAFLSEPLVNRISPEKRIHYSRETALNSIELANEIRQKYSNISIAYLVEKLEINLIEQVAQDGGGFSMFASFEEPNVITVYKDISQATDKLIDDSGLRETVGNVKTIDLLFYHELYHFLEFTRDDVYSTQQKVLVWRIGPFKNISRIRCLGEIGAMNFSRELLKLPYSPNLFNVLMLYAQNPVSAERLYLKMLDVKEG